MTHRPGRNHLSGLFVWLAMCMGVLLPPPLQAQNELTPKASYERIVGELYPEETGPFYSFYAGLDAYDRLVLARVIERLDSGEWGLFGQLLTQTDRPTAIKTLRIFGGYSDDQLDTVTGFLRTRSFERWQKIPPLVRGESYANARTALLGRRAEGACEYAPSDDLIGASIDPNAPAARYCSETETLFFETFFQYSFPAITRGKFAREGDIPWQVQFSRYGPSTLARKSPEARAGQRERFGRELKDWEINHTCGGVYLGAKFVLTAAHCIGELQDARFFAGRRVHLGSIKINGQRNLYTINKVLVHAGFNDSTLQHDIALIQLDKVPTGYGRNLRSVIPARTPATPSDDLSLLISGWGYIRPTTSSNNFFALDGKRQLAAQPSLLMGEVWVKKASKCKSNRHFRRRQINLYPGQICVGSPEGVDACRGDSGGPLVNTQSEVLIGLVSGGAGCGLEDTPSIFTDVGYYRDWIDRAKRAAPRLRSKRKHKFR